LAKLINPVLFSTKFPIPACDLTKANLLDPILNADTRLFIDPLLLSGSDNELIRTKAFSLLKERFEEIILLVDASQSAGDVAWRNASKRLDLSERRETGLGYGGASTSGSSRPQTLKTTILNTTKEILILGSKDPQIISLMGMFEEGVGPDTISDLTTNMILPVLCEITTEFCANYSIPLKQFRVTGQHRLPANPTNPESPILLVPRDILRDLPFAADWPDVSRAVLEIQHIRDAFNDFVGPIAKATLAQKKRALRNAVLESLETFKKAFSAILNASDSYDPKADFLNFYAFREIITSRAEAYSGSISPAKAYNRDELVRIVKDIVAHFRHLVENNNLWELMWNGDVPKKERAAQLLFFGIAAVCCKANGVDISPEMHAGGGPVDFKFSTGYHNRVLVEVKRSVGTVEHGYTKQLEIYKTASRTDAAIFLILDVGGMGTKLQKIKHLQEKSRLSGDPVSEIEVVDAKRKPSASRA
jgi:hypothetical protein